MAVTMKQIAQDLGVSVVTVSKALRNREDVGRETRERVLQRSRELQYRPNLTARSLVTGRSSLVGLLVPDLIHPFFAEIARALAAALRKDGLYLLICSSEGDAQLESEQLEHLMSRQLDAIVVAPVGGDDAALASVSASATPLVLIDRRAEIAGAHFIGVHDALVGEMATEHLISIGCKRIAHLRGPDNSVGIKRLEGYKRALKKAGIPFRPELVSAISHGDVESKVHGAEAAIELLAQKPRPDGFFCFSDPMAIGAMDTALDRGISIPKQLAIIGCGNLHYDDSLRVPLSSLDQQSARIGARAAAIVLDQVKRKALDAPGRPSPVKFEQVVLRPRLVARQSTNR